MISNTPCGPNRYKLPCSLGRYELRAELGRGVAIVYEGWDPLIKRRVAVKTIDLPPEGEAEEELARFRREVEAAGQLKHPNIVKAYDYGETARVAYIVMEFVEGRTLKVVLSDRERLTVPNALRVIDDVLAALQHSHERGVIHRDIKPANIILAPDGHAEVADFGIAKIESGFLNQDLTQVGTVMGTWAYMSPEQAEGKIADARTDIYSTGLVLYQLLTGERPSAPKREGGMGLIERRALGRRIHKHSKLSLAASRRVAAVIERATALSVQDRYPSAEEFRRALRDAMRQRSSISAAVAPAVAAIALVSAWLFWLAPALYPDVSKLRRAVATAIDPIRCALVSGDVSERETVITLSGVAASEAEARLKSAVARAAHTARLDWHVTSFAGPYCEALDLLRPFSRTFGASSPGLAISMDGDRPELNDGDPIVVRITAPNYPSVVQLDYLQGDGTVYHMQQPSFNLEERYAPSTEHVSWELGSGVPPLTVLPPFGTDMIIAVASDKPLFLQARPPVESIQDYLRDLEDAVVEARRRGESLSSAALVLMTRPRP